MERKYGISYLKIILSFLIVTCHFYEVENVDLIVRLRIAAVPCFMLISFYLTADMFKNLEYERVFKRIDRLYYPFAIWGGVTGSYI